jgi:hypothetical protein
MATAPKQYEDLLRQHEKTIREYIEQLNYYELQIEKHEQDNIDQKDKI